MKNNRNIEYYHPQVKAEGGVYRILGNMNTEPIVALREFYHNSDDAGATEYNILRTKTGLVFEDNGHGMTKQGLMEYFDIARLLEEVIEGIHGSFNAGGKQGAMALSDKMVMTTITPQGEVTQATAVWLDLFRGQPVMIESISDAQIKKQLLSFKHGTRIELIANDDAKMISGQKWYHVRREIMREFHFPLSKGHVILNLDGTKVDALPMPALIGDTEKVLRVSMGDKVGVIRMGVIHPEANFKPDESAFTRNEFTGMMTIFKDSIISCGDIFSAESIWPHASKNVHIRFEMLEGDWHRSTNKDKSRDSLLVAKEISQQVGWLVKKGEQYYTSAEEKAISAAINACCPPLKTIEGDSEDSQNGPRKKPAAAGGAGRKSSGNKGKAKSKSPTHKVEEDSDLMGNVEAGPISPWEIQFDRVANTLSVFEFSDGDIDKGQQVVVTIQCTPGNPNAIEKMYQESLKNKTMRQYFIQWMVNAYYERKYNERWNSSIFGLLRTQVDNSIIHYLGQCKFE